MRKLAAVVVALGASAAGACGGPSSFVRGEEAPVRRVPVRKELAYERAFEEALRVVSSRLPVSASSKEEGVVETSWSADWPKPGQKKYRVRAIVRFDSDRRALTVRTEAEYGKPGSVRPGSDVVLRDVLARELETALGPAELREAPAAFLPPRRLIQSEEGDPKSPPFDVRLRADITRVRGVVKSDADGAADTTIRLGEDGGLGSGAGAGIELAVQPGPRFAVALGYSRREWTGDALMANDEWYDGVLFPAGSVADARLTLEQVDLTPKYVLNEGRGVLLEAGVRLSYLRADFEMDGPLGEAREGESLFLLAPSLRAGTVARAGPYLVGEFRPIFGIPGFTYGVEASVGGGFRFGPLDAELGLRGSWIDAFRGTREDLRVNTSGLYLALTIRF